MSPVVGDKGVPRWQERVRAMSVSSIKENRALTYHLVREYRFTIFLRGVINKFGIKFKICG
jgi:hypothetical protein